jgi:hypothetical protein
MQFLFQMLGAYPELRRAKSCACYTKRLTHTMPAPPPLTQNAAGTLGSGGPACRGGVNSSQNGGEGGKGGELLPLSAPTLRACRGRSRPCLRGWCGRVRRRVASGERAHQHMAVVAAVWAGRGRCMEENEGDHAGDARCCYLAAVLCGFRSRGPCFSPLSWTLTVLAAGLGALRAEHKI